MDFVREAGVEPPVVLDGAMPKAVPKDASDESVVLEFSVARNGAATDVRVIHGSKSASELLTRNLATWKFQPATKGGVPTQATGRVRFIKGRGDDAANLPLFEGRETPSPATSPAIAGAGGGFTSPRLLHRVEADYTDAARNARIGGVVVVQIVVDAMGEVTDAKVIASLGYGLDEKAIEAVKKWKFDAARQNGQPVAASIKVEIVFRSM